MFVTPASPEQQSRLEEILRGVLSQAPDGFLHDPAWASDLVVPNLARNLLAISWMRLEDRSPARIRQLREINQLAADLRGKVHEASFQTQNSPEHEMWRLMTLLPLLDRLIALTDVNGRTGLVRQLPPGAPVKLLPRTVANHAATIFEGFTNKAPTVRSRDGKAYGPFLDFVRDIFDALGFEKASAESQARRAVRELKQFKASSLKEKTPPEVLP